MSRVLITGATGNIGTALLRRLAVEPGVEVSGVVRREPSAEPPYDQVSWHCLDLSEVSSQAPLTELMAGVDAVVHLVWGFQPTRDDAYLERVDVGASTRVLAAADEAGVAHLVHLSSVGTYAPKRSNEPVDESYPHTGMPTSSYSRYKAEVERNLDSYELAHPDGMTISRVRPGIVLQRDAGAALSRYGLPGYLPAPLLRLVPLLPLDRAFCVPVVHADDVAEALARILQRRAAGAFNLAADAPLTRADVAAVLGARSIHTAAPILRGVVNLSWRLHLQPLSPGWIDLAFNAPMLDTARARAELDWSPSVGSRKALADAVAGIIENAGTASPAWRPRSAAGRLRKLITTGPVSKRRLP